MIKVLLILTFVVPGQPPSEMQVEVGTVAECLKAVENFHTNADLVAAITETGGAMIAGCAHLRQPKQGVSN
jgi:hypothetical protein